MNLQNYLNIDQISSKNIKKIFFYRVCGTGMGAAACLLKEAGYEVAGADSMFYPPMSTYLESSGIEILKLSEIDISTKLSEYDLIVVGNVVTGSSDEARKIEEVGVPFCSFPAVIGSLLLKNKRVIGLSGTHGKTTSTYIGAQVFEKLGHECGYFIGGVMDNRPPSRLGKSEYFFIESDEYDSAYFEKYSKFQSYFIDSLVITSLEFDHADIFTSIEDIKKEFKKVIPSNKQVIGCSDWKEILSLKKIFKEIDWIDYGKETVSIIEQSEFGTKFKLKYLDETKVFKTNLVGFHNILNLTSILLFALTEGFTDLELNSAIDDLKLVKRRQEVKGKFNDSIVVDDFAHHPTAVRETLKAIKIQYPKKKINVFLEPGSATARSDIFQDDFLDSLEGASMVTIIKPARPTTAKGHGNLNVDQISSALNNVNIDTVVVDSLEKILDRFKKYSNKDTVNLVMSNGTCLGLWSSDFVKNFSK